MKKGLLFLSSVILSFALSAQATDDCYKKLEEAFMKRGAYTVADNIHSNVIISFFDKDGTTCVSGKVRVENGQIISIFLQYDDNTYELMETKFYNEKKSFPTITNGISEMIYTADGQKLKVVFIEKLKPKQKNVKTVTIPDDL